MSRWQRAPDGCRARTAPGTLAWRDHLAGARRAVSGPDWIVPWAARDASGERMGMYRWVSLQQSGAACVLAGGTASVGRSVVSIASRHDLFLTTPRQAGREARSRHMIAAEGLAAVGCMIAAYRRSDGAATYYKIDWVTGAAGS